MPVTMYSSALSYLGVALQGAVGTPASSPSVILPIMRSQMRWMEWMEGRQPEDDSTGDYYTEVDAPVSQPHSEGTIVCPARLTGLNSFLAMCGIAGGGSPSAMVPPGPLTIFQGLGPDEEIFSDVFLAGQPAFTCPENGNATWSFPLVGMTLPTTHAFRAVTFPAYEASWQMHNLLAVTLVNSSGQLRFNQFTANLIVTSLPQYYSRGDGLAAASDVILDKLGGFLDFRRAYNSLAEKTAFLAACGQVGTITFPFQSVCGATNTLTFTLQNGLYQTRKMDTPQGAPSGEAFSARGLRGSGGAPSPVLIGYS